MRRIFAGLVLIIATSCKSESIPTSPLQAPDLSFGRAPTPPPPRALLVFSDFVNVAAPGAPEDLRPAGITGDSRLRGGGASTGSPSNEYQGELCGVQANIENGPRQSGELSYDPDNGYTSATACGPARFYNFYLAGSGSAPTQAAPLSRVFGIWALAVGESANKGQGFGVQFPNCSTLMFSIQYGGDDLRVTRVDDGTGPRRWVVASQGSHLAACVIPSKRGSTATGVKYYLPFSLNVTEVP